MRCGARVWRDRTTGRTLSSKLLVRGADCEVDEFQGCISFARPLAQMTLADRNSITYDAPLDGNEQRLLVDYEYAPSGLDSPITTGARGKYWLGEHVAGCGTYLKVERSESESTSAPVFFSDDGGLSFRRLNPVGPREGGDTSVELRSNLQEQGLGQYLEHRRLVARRGRRLLDRAHRLPGRTGDRIRRGGPGRVGVRHQPVRQAQLG